MNATLHITKSVNLNKYTKPTTLLQQPLTTKQQVYSNYLVPVLFTSIIYILNFTADSCLALQHFREENYLYASLTFFFIYVPVIGSIFFTLSDVTIWPSDTGCGKENLKWLFIKLAEHLFFPVWAMYRFAEQLFWSIEAVRFNDKDEFEELIRNAERNSVFELYHFLQAYLQAVPQILFQLHIIFRHTAKFNKVTVDMQVFCVIISLIKMAMTTTSYQRFKSQKISGKEYPWKKDREIIHTLQESYKMLGSSTNIKETIQEEEEPEENKTADANKESERKSDEETGENSEPEVDRDQNEILPAPVSRRSSGLSESSSQFDMKLREKYEVKDGVVIPLKVVLYRGRPEDDAAGKLVAFFWWFCFILPRMLSLSAFAYFYPKEILWICCSHYIITLAFLLYDAHISDIPYYRGVFILFTSYIYMFCLIEFKIKFKKVKFIYNGYFLLVYFENLVMTCIWYYSIDFDSDWWYKYIFYVIAISSMFSVTSMMFYIYILKPKKVVLHQEYRASKIL